LRVLRKELINMSEEDFNYVDKPFDTIASLDSLNGDKILSHKRFARKFLPFILLENNLLPGPLFDSQEHYDAWRKEIRQSRKEGLVIKDESTEDDDFVFIINNNEETNIPEPSPSQTKKAIKNRIVNKWQEAINNVLSIDALDGLKVEFKVSEDYQTLADRRGKFGSTMQSFGIFGNNTSSINTINKMFAAKEKQLYFVEEHKAKLTEEKNKLFQI